MRFPYRKDLYLKEGLMDDVEVDEVVDDIEDADCDGNRVIIYVNYTKCTKDLEYFLRCLNKWSVCGKVSVENISEDDFSDSDDEISVDFILGDNVSLEDFCILICMLIMPSLPASSVEIKNDSVSPFQCKFNPCLYDSMELSLIYVDRFCKFFKCYYPDASDKEIIDTFVRKYVRLKPNREKYTNVVKFFDDGNTTNEDDEVRAVIVDENGKFISNELLNDCTGFCEGFTVVKRNKKYNYMDKHGNLLSEIWFDCCYGFKNGFGVVKIGNTENYIDKDGNYLLSIWYDSCSNFYKEGFATIELKNKYNFVDTSGKVISSMWFDEVSGVNGEGFVAVRKKNKWNYVDATGNILSKDLWFTKCLKFVGRFAKVKIGRYWNFIDKDGKLLLDETKFQSLSNFSEGLAKVELKNKCNYINESSEIVFDTWYYGCFDFREGFAAVIKSPNVRNFIDKNGRIISPDLWFGYCDYFKNGFAIVINEVDGNVSKRNFIDTNGKLISNEWFDYADNFDGGFALVYNKTGNDYIYNFINTKGELMLDTWSTVYGEYVVKDGMVILSDGNLCIDSEHNLVFVV